MERASQSVHVTEVLLQFWVAALSTVLLTSVIPRTSWACSGGGYLKIEYPEEAAVVGPQISFLIAEDVDPTLTLTSSAGNVIDLGPSEEFWGADSTLSFYTRTRPAKPLEPGEYTLSASSSFGPFAASRSFVVDGGFSEAPVTVEATEIRDEGNVSSSCDWGDTLIAVDVRVAEPVVETLGYFEARYSSGPNEPLGRPFLFLGPQAPFGTAPKMTLVTTPPGEHVQCAEIVPASKTGRRGPPTKVCFNERAGDVLADTGAVEDTGFATPNKDAGSDAGTAGAVASGGCATLAAGPSADVGWWSLCGMALWRCRRRPRGSSNRCCASCAGSPRSEKTRRGPVGRSSRRAGWQPAVRRN